MAAQGIVAAKDMPCNAPTWWALRAYSSSPPVNLLRLDSGYSPTLDLQVPVVGHASAGGDLYSPSAAQAACRGSQALNSEGRSPYRA